MKNNINDSPSSGFYSDTVISDLEEQSRNTRARKNNANLYSDRLNSSDEEANVSLKRNEEFNGYEYVS